MIDKILFFKLNTHVPHVTLRPSHHPEKGITHPFVTSQMADLLLEETLHKSRAEEVKGGHKDWDLRVQDEHTLLLAYCERLCRKRTEGTERTTMSPKPTSSSGGQTTLETVDIVVLVIYFLLILAVGLWVSLSSLATRLFSCQNLWLKNVNSVSAFPNRHFFWCRFVEHCRHLASLRNIRSRLTSTANWIFVVVFLTIVAV